MDNDENETIKIAVVGEVGVGKTQLIMDFVYEGLFEKDHQITTGGTFSIKTGKCDNGKTLKFEIWDTAGQKKYRSSTRLFYKDINAVIMVYNITIKQTFEELKIFWTDEIKEKAGKDVILAIAANYSDLINHEEVDEVEAREYAKSIDALFFSVSQKNVKTIENLFTEIGKKYMKCGNITYDIDEDEYTVPPKQRGDIKTTGKKAKGDKYTTGKKAKGDKYTIHKKAMGDKYTFHKKAMGDNLKINKYLSY